jgi:feruloyl-CoA synthase
VAGHDRDCIGLLAWPNLEGMKRICGDLARDGDAGRLISEAAVADHIRAGIAAHNARSPSSSHAIRRVLLLREPPAIDANEITDKGYINQRAVLERRGELVARLFATPAGADVIVIT